MDLTKVEWPKVDLSRIEWTREDLDKAILGLTAATRLVRPAVRSRRLPLGLGFIALASLATFALLSRPSVRDRLATAARDVRRRADAVRAGSEPLEIEGDTPSSLEETAAVAIPIEADAFTDVPGLELDTPASSVEEAVAEIA